MKLAPLCVVLGLACPTWVNAQTPSCRNGLCDTPSVRDSYRYDIGQFTQLVPIKVAIHQFRANTSVPYPLTDAQINSAVALANTIYASGNIELRAQIYPHTDAAYNGTRSSISVAPYFIRGKLNVWVVENTLYPGTDDCTDALAGFPWDGNSLGSGGGVYYIHKYDLAMQGTSGPSHSLTHEIGHALGLWHVENGAFGVECNDACYECPAATTAQRDRSGDMCSDTPPQIHIAQGTPCSEYQFSVDCHTGQNHQYPLIEYNNIMGLNCGQFCDGATNECRTQLTAQQFGRMRCWTNSRLICWVDYVKGDFDCSGTVSQADIIKHSNYVNGTGSAACPLPMAGDYNCSGTVNATDTQILINYVYYGGGLPGVCCLGDDCNQYPCN